MTATSSLVDAARRELSDLNDQITGAHDSGYEEARAVQNGMIDKRPALIVRCGSPEEIARCIAFGRAHSLPVAVRGEGTTAGAWAPSTTGS